MVTYSEVSAKNNNILVNSFIEKVTVQNFHNYGFSDYSKDLIKCKARKARFLHSMLSILFKCF